MDMILNRPTDEESSGTPVDGCPTLDADLEPLPSAGSMCSVSVVLSSGVDQQ